MKPKPAANEYLRTKILTARPEELRLMLYDGAIKFCTLAKKAVAERNIEESFECLMRAQKIVLELSTSLNHEVSPEICAKLDALYTYVYRLLVDANVQKEERLIDEALRLLEYERETWLMLIEKAAQENGEAGAEQADVAGAQQTAISTLSANA